MKIYSVVVEYSIARWFSKEPTLPGKQTHPWFNVTANQIYNNIFVYSVVDDETTLRIELGRGDVPLQGENVTIMCITSGPEAPINPEWLTRTGEVIRTLEQGKD